MKRPARRPPSVGDLASVPGLALVRGRKTGRVRGAFVSDMPSSALARLGRGEVWITGWPAPAVLAVAARKKAAAVILTEGGEFGREALSGTATPVLYSAEGNFEVAGKIYAMLERV